MGRAEAGRGGSGVGCGEVRVCTGGEGWGGVRWGGVWASVAFAVVQCGAAVGLARWGCSGRLLPARGRVRAVGLAWALASCSCLAVVVRPPAP